MRFNFVRTTLILALLFLIPSVQAAAEIIYDNTSTSLGHFAPERLEYGDQLDLEGTARTLTEVDFEYFAQFDPDGSQGMKVRIYTNEEVYDLYRKAPTKLIYESGFLPVNTGYSSRRIQNLSVPLPRDSVTVTVEFFGIKTNEQAGLLLYSPPTVGFSFNEFWRRTPNGRWEALRYSSTETNLKANASIRLTAVPQAVVDQEQSAWGAEYSLRDARTRVRAAQVFTPQVSGRLDRITSLLYWSGKPLRVRILDAPGRTPGTNVLGTTLLTNSVSSLSADFYDQSIYLEAGQPCAIEFSTDEGFTADLNYTLRCTAGAAATNGWLWSKNEAEAGAPWRKVTERNDGVTGVSAVFATWIVPGAPTVRITTPHVREQLTANAPVRIRTALDLPPGKDAARVRFFANGEQIGESSAAPYEFVWNGAPPGNHVLRAFAEDTLREVYRSENVEVVLKASDTPANDDFATAVTLSGILAHASAATEGATLESNEPRVSTNSAGASIWWAWTAPNDLPVTISAQNSQGAATVGVFTGTDLANLTAVASGVPSCIFVPSRGTRYVIVADPLVRGEEVVLDIASADPGLLSPASGTIRTAGETVSIGAGTASSRQIVGLQFYANEQLIQEATHAPFSFDQLFSQPGIYNLTVAATDDRGIRTVSLPSRLGILPAGESYDASVFTKRIIDGSISVVFDSPPGVPVTIEYSDDLKEWKTSPITVAGNGKKIAWIDNGPPKTERHPRQSPKRFYRLNFGFPSSP